jgi:type II secretory pathway pseudopilin PulG
VTLLEILIVLALIIATAAIAIPAMTNRFENTRFDATIDQLVATLSLSRAEAQRQRRPVQLLWDPDVRAVYAARLENQPLPSEEDGSSFDVDAAKSADPDDESSMSDRLNAAGAESKALATGGSRLRVVLPEGCSVEVGLPAMESDRDEPDPRSRSEFDRVGGTLSAQPVSLIVYMPDGSTFGNASFRVVDTAGRQVRIDVNPWTGQAAARRIESASSDSMMEPDTEGDPIDRGTSNGEEP